MRHRAITTWAISVAGLIWSESGHAEANSCANAYEQAQELRAEQKLQLARQNLQVCVEPSCPDFVRGECGRWLVEVENSLPTVVLAAKKSGHETEKVRVLYDGAALVERLDGKAIAVDPGPHTLTFIAVGDKPVELKVVFREGEKNRIVEADIGEEVVRPVAGPPEVMAKADQPRDDASTSRASWLPYGFGGLGVLGVTGFALLGVMGNHALQDRENHCAPTCSDAEVNSVRTKYYLADISLGVGVVSLGVAGYLFLTSPSRRPGPAPVGQHFDLGLGKNSGYATFHVKF